MIRHKGFKWNRRASTLLKLSRIGIIFASINFVATLFTLLIAFQDKSMVDRLPIIFNPFLWNFPSWILAGIMNNMFHWDFIFYITMLIAGAFQWYLIGNFLSRIMNRIKHGAFYLDPVVFQSLIGWLLFIIHFGFALNLALNEYHYAAQNANGGWSLIYFFIIDPLAFVPAFLFYIFIGIVCDIAGTDSVNNVQLQVLQVMPGFIIFGSIQWYLIGYFIEKLAIRAKSFCTKH